uniref:Uncharacterized protein n=1 Tax=Kalanchoe fedtschenkoi TaxID=63787 RepID=A0A7N0TXS8_KALFE
MHFLHYSVLRSSVQPGTLLSSAMRDNWRSSSSSSSPSSSSSSSIAATDSTSPIFSRVGYKAWVLAAILLLALWSMFAGTIHLKRAAGNLNPSSEHIDSVLRDDHDVLEVEEREKVVRRMWDVYSSSKRSNRTRLPRFLQEAFEAAYEHLVSDDPEVRNAAVMEIAKMSMMSNNGLQSYLSAVVSQSQSRKPGEPDKKSDWRGAVQQQNQRTFGGGRMTPLGLENHDRKSS